jgi:hypothetical protein
MKTRGPERAQITIPKAVRERLGIRPGLVAAIVFLVIWGLTTHGKYSAVGDEPHYLIMTESLWSDGDLDLETQYGSGVSRVFGHPELAIDGHARYDRMGTLRSVHDVGLPVLLVPIYGPAIAVSQLVPESWLLRVSQTPGLFAYSLMSLSMLALVCLSLTLLMKTLTPPIAPAAAATVVLATALSPPLLSHAFLLFPEGIAFVVVCLTIYVAYSARDVSYGHIVVVSGAVGLLPWIHRKFSLFAVGLLFVLIVERREIFRRLSRAQRGGVALAFLGPQVVLATWTFYLWGHPGGPLMVGESPFGWQAFRAGVFGLLIDRENGLLVWAPLYLALPAAWWLTRHASGALVIPSILLFVPAAAHHLWWGGFSPAGRFLVPLIPFFALVIANALRHRTFAVTWYALLVPQFLVSAYGWQHTRQLWPQGTGENPLVTSLPGLGPMISDLLPSLRATSPEVSSAALWILGMAIANIVLVAIVSRSSTSRLRG